MTLEELKQYRAIRLEIDAIEEQIDEMYNTYHSPSFGPAASVNSEPHSPVENALRKIQKLERVYNAKLDNLRERAEAIEEWLEPISGTFVGACIRYHYLLGYSWKETSRKMYGYDSYQNARKVVYRYFEQK